MINYQLTKKGSSYKSYISAVKSMYEKPITQTSTAVILTFATIAFFGFTAIRPTLGTVSKLIKELDEKQILDEKMTNKMSTLTTVDEAYTNNQELLSVFQDSIPTEKGLDLFLLELEYLSYQSPVTLTSLRVGETKVFGLETIETGSKNVEGDPFPSISLNLTVQGDRQDLVEYLDQLENLRRLVRIESVSFSNATDSPELKSESMSVGFVVFWDPQEINLSKQ